VWGLEDLEPRAVLPDHHNKVYCLAALDDDAMVSGSGDGSIKVWDPTTWECIQTLEGHRTYVWALLSERECFFSSSDDRSVRVWSKQSRQCVHVMTDPRNKFLSLGALRYTYCSCYLSILLPLVCFRELIMVNNIKK